MWCMDLVYFTKFPGIRWLQTTVNAKPKKENAEAKKHEATCAAQDVKKKEKNTKQTLKEINPEMLMLSGLFSFFTLVLVFSFLFFSRLVYPRFRFCTGQKTIDV